MRILIIAVGKLKDRRIRELCDDYLKRARRHLRVEIIEVKHDDAISRHLPDRRRVVALDAAGRTLSSEAFSAWIAEQMNRGLANLVFVIGGSHGLSAQAREGADELLSLGPMTLPHRLARLVLVEQLYRGIGILRGEPYHH